MYCVVVAAPPAVRRPEDLARLPAAADLVELRLDLLVNGADPEGLASWIAASPRPVLATVRSRGQGGRFEGPPEEAARLLARAAEAGALWVDVEEAVAGHLPTLPPGVRVLASSHGRDPAWRPDVVAGRPVDHVKIARPVGEAEAFVSLLAEGREAETLGAVTVLPYGPLGAARAALVHPGSWLYGAAAADAAVVEGQPRLLDLLDELRAGEVSAAPRWYGLLGAPPGPSPSPALHNAAFRTLALDALYLPLPGLSVGEALRMPFQGFSVTMPHKAEALAKAATADETARVVGAANTLVRREDGAWHALNTDVEAIHISVPPARSGATACLHGAGGYARAAAVALRARGFGVRIVARHPQRGRGAALAVGAEFAGPSFRRLETDEVLVNATPAGHDGVVPSFLADTALEDLVVLDAPYRRDGEETGVALRAKASGARMVVGGLALLLRQAVGQVQAFTGRDVDMRLLEVALDPPPPLVLLGLRGAGKSTVGRALARRLGRPFLDLDEDVERRTGRTPAAWIREHGEAAFRESEVGALSHLAGRRGIVVAAGGGVLEHPEARAHLEEGMRPVWLDVPPEIAALRVSEGSVDRPPLVEGLDPLDEARRIHARRRDAWAETARAVVDATGPVDAVVEAVAEAWLQGDTKGQESAP